VRRSVRAISSLVVGFVGAIVATSPVSAALCAKWDPPAPVAVGSAASISFRTYVPVSGNGDPYNLKPRAFPDYPFQVQALSPEGGASRIDVAPSPEDDRVWVGNLTPDREGAWTLTIVDLQGADVDCYTDSILSVEQERSSLALTVAALGLVVILGGVAGFWLMSRRRSP
jgi:hypothetical protein